MSIKDFIEAFIVGSAGLAALGLTLHKLNLLRITDKSPAAAAEALARQFEIMKTAFTDMESRQKTLEAMLTNMDKKIHEQQRTITRMEMLLRQFSGLVQEHGITVPSFMQEELKELIDDTDKPVYSRLKEALK